MPWISWVRMTRIAMQRKRTALLKRAQPKSIASWPSPPPPRIPAMAKNERMDTTDTPAVRMIAGRHSGR